MATTALNVKTDDGIDVNLIFQTTQLEENIIVVNIYKGDENYNPVGTASVSVADFPSEEAYHRELREQASEKNQFAKEYSTNPEWNPGYVEPENEEDAI